MAPLSPPLSRRCHSRVPVPSLQITTRWPKRWGAKASWWGARTASGWTPSSAPRRMRAAAATPSSSTPSSARPTSARAPSLSRDCPLSPPTPPRCPAAGMRGAEGCPGWVPPWCHRGVPNRGWANRGVRAVASVLCPLTWGWGGGQWCPLAIKQRRVPPPAILCHQFGCHGAFWGLPPPPPRGHHHTHTARRRVQLVSFIAGDSDKAVGRAGWASGHPGGDTTGDSVVTEPPPWPGGTPCPGDLTLLAQPGRAGAFTFSWFL